MAYKVQRRDWVNTSRDMYGRTRLAWTKWRTVFTTDCYEQAQDYFNGHRGQGLIDWRIKGKVLNRGR